MILWSLSKFKFYWISKFEKPSTVQIIQITWLWYFIFYYKRKSCIQNINLFEYFRRWINIFASFSWRKFFCTFLTRLSRRFVILAALIGLQATPSTNIIKREAILIKFIAEQSFFIFRSNYFDLSFCFDSQFLYAHPSKRILRNFEIRRVLLSVLLTSILEFWDQSSVSKDDILKHGDIRMINLLFW